MWNLTRRMFGTLKSLLKFFPNLHYNENYGYLIGLEVL